MPNRLLSLLGAGVFTLLPLVGCTPSVSETKPTNKATADPKAPEKSVAEQTGSVTPAAPATDKPNTTPPVVGKGMRVLLGTGELTSGIPGSGPLSVDEIKAWLTDPKNHAELEVELPLGLRAGAGQVKGLKDNPLTRAKIELGRQLYFDKRLSVDATISCASCHSPGEGYAAHTQFGVGVREQQGGRNSPVSYNRILSDKQFWDGRAASLEEQAKGPIANPIEMANTHDACVATLQKIEGYQLQFEKIFGSVTIDNVAQAIASFERVVVTNPSPFDYYDQVAPYLKLNLTDLQEDDPPAYQAYLKAKATSDKHPLSESARRGHAIYFSEKGSCSACHVGPNLSDEQYHNIGVGMKAEKPDLGRYDVTKEDKDRGAFKTPTIRNVALTAPYMHDGSLKTLEEVVEFYAKGGEANPHLDPKMKKLNLTPQDKADLVAFMQACTGEFPPVEQGRLPK